MATVGVKALITEQSIIKRSLSLFLAHNSMTARCDDMMSD